LWFSRFVGAIRVRAAVIVDQTGLHPRPVGGRAPLRYKLSAVITALYRAVAALSAPPMRRVVAVSLGLAVLTFAVLWLAVAATLYNTVFFDWRPLNWLVDL